MRRSADRCRQPSGVPELRSGSVRPLEESHPRAPALPTGGARRFCEALQARGILAKETHPHTIRFAPPFVVERADLEWALGEIGAVLA